MINEDKLVKVSVVARNALSIGRFGLFQIEEEDMNLIVTDQFMLNVTEEQFWKIQCKLEARQKNRWLFKGKDGLAECSGATPEEICDMYTGLITEARHKLENTYLTFHNVMVYTNDVKYIGLPAKNLEMIDYTPTIEIAPGRESAIVDGIHLFTITESRNTDCKYLRPAIEIERG